MTERGYSKIESVRERIKYNRECEREDEVKIEILRECERERRKYKEIGREKD